MPSIAMGSMGTGLPKDLVQRLVDAEREPIRQLEVHKKDEETKLKLVNDLSAKVTDIAGSLKDLTRFRNFRELSATNGRPEVMDVTVDK
ncbi:MAG: flagellar cap protein FliD N-terminal domain-containing protein, partial [Bdellovibrionota bacterium]